MKGKIREGNTFLVTALVKLIDCWTLRIGLRQTLLLPSVNGVFAKIGLLA